MARLPRLSVPGFAHHLLQRGNNRQPIFADEADFEAMRALLAAHARAERVALHAYVLMPNHFHLIATPQTEDGLPRFMQAIGRGYVRAFNDRHGRSGTLWEGRFRCAVLQAERHLLPAMAYCDLNPVRAGLVAAAADWQWSSHAHFAGARTDRLVTPHALYWALGNTPFAREQAYEKRLEAGIGAAERQALTESLLGGWALGDAAFLADLQSRSGRRVSKGAPGRPRAKPFLAAPDGQENGPQRP